jgi:hypothetical protein
VKETYKNMDLLLKAISYSKYGWKICGDLKVIGLLLKCSLATQSCAIFFLNGTAEQKTSIKKLKIGPCQETQFQGKSVSEIHHSLTKIRLPTLHIKLGLMKNFVQAMNKHGKVFE